MSEIKSVAIIGAGQMGSGIAHVAALAGYDVCLHDVAADRIDAGLANISKNLARQVSKDVIDQAAMDAALKRIKAAPGAAEVGVCDLVIEAATENEEVKKAIFRGLEGHLKPGVILASNTSSISITRLAAVTAHPEKFIGLHFMNPVPIMKLVEIIRGHLTSDATANAVVEASKAVGKIPVVAGDYPGFVSNRVLMPLINEAIFAVFEGVATPEAVDEVFKLGMAHPMGPLTLADFIGLDVCLDILRVLQEGFGDPKYRPCPLLVQMVAAGKLGRKSGQGFYAYDK